MKQRILVPILLLLFNGAVSAQVCQTIPADMPIRMDVDGVMMVSSKFYLNLAFGSCDLSLSKAGPKTPEAAVGAIVQSLVSGDFAAYQKTFSPLDDTNEENVEMVFDYQSAAYQKDPPDRITQKYTLGDLDFFVLGDSSRPFLHSLLVIHSPDKSCYNGRSFTLQPLVENLDATIKVLPEDFRAFSEPPGGNYLKVSDVLPNYHGAVTCFFQGQATDWNILKQPLSDYHGPYKDLMAFYQSSYLNLVNRKQEAFLESFSPASRQKVQAMIDASSFEEYAFNNTLMARRVRFILDADPVYFIYWHSADGDNLQYEMVLKTDGGKFQRVNFQHHTLMDHLLGDQSFAESLQNIAINSGGQ
ncbi:MAG TPA: hypothetical protein VK791_05885 [bacterium]|jgi:hypothetical protein|nr:hypothetical protein [bacterium]